MTKYKKTREYKPHWHPKLGTVGLLAKKLGVPTPIEEYRFHPVRLWRFDQAWPEYLLALEIDGGSWVNGRHNRAIGFQKDCEKFNAATELGWRVLHYTYDMIESDPLKVAKQVSEAIKMRG